jgi:ketosteroid isomerase-like protein
MSHENVGRGDCVRLTGLNTTRQRRTLDERIFIRFPALSRAFALLWWKLPRRSRLRRMILVRRAGQGAAAGNRRDFDVLLAGFDPEIDFRIVSGTVGEIVPDLVGHHHGHEGYRDAWRAMLEAFADFSLQPQEVHDLGDRMIGVVRMSGHGSGSGVPVSQLVFQLYTFRDGLIVKQEDFGTLDEALEAAGLRE